MPACLLQIFEGGSGSRRNASPLIERLKNIRRFEKFLLPFQKIML